MIKKRLVLSGTVFIFIILGFCFQAQAAKWTFMVYLIGDNDLELAAINDFLEMAAVGSNSDVRIVVQFDRSSAHDSSYGDWTTTKRFYITSGMTPTSANALMDLGEVNMADPNSLRDFINWATNNYPADRYALVLWDHGNGWRLQREQLIKALNEAGTQEEKEQIERALSELSPIKSLGPDDSNPGDGLHTKEIKTALNAASTNLHFIGFDACLMGMIEVAYELKDSGPAVMVASEEGISTSGWPYTTILNGLKNNPNWTPAQLANWVADKFIEANSGSEGIAAIDLTTMSTMAARVSELASALSSNWNQARNAAQNVLIQFPPTVIKSYPGTTYPQAHGLSIYFPFYPDWFSNEYNGSIIDFPGNTNWDEFLSTYYQRQLQSVDDSWEWIKNARMNSQEFDFTTYIDLYDFCQEILSYPLTLWEALDFPFIPWDSGGDGEFSGWAAQTTTYLKGGSAAQSANVSHGQSAWLQTTVKGPGTINFYWKVSSEQNFDWLEFYIDGVRQERISGEVDWELEVFPIPAGNHTLTWKYAKDGSISHGSDCGRVDSVLYSIAFSTVLDNPPLVFTSSGYAGWFGQAFTYHTGDSAAQNREIPRGQSSLLQTTVTGPGTIYFYWKVSSEANFDRLEFHLDGVRQGYISGEIGWELGSFNVPAGTHTLTWKYMKDDSISRGADCGWVDSVSYSIDFQVALDNNQLNFISGGDAGWFGQSSIYYYGGSALQNRDIGDGQSSWLETTASGPCSISFYWKVSSEAGYDWLEFSIDGVRKDRISGLMDWQQKTFLIPSGSHVLRWTYVKDSSISSGSDTAWVDRITYVCGGIENIFLPFIVR